MHTTKEIWQKHFGDTPSVGLDHQNIESFFSEVNEACINEDENKISQRYLMHVLTSSTWHVKVTPNIEQYYVAMHFDGFSIKLRIEAETIDVWVQSKSAYTAVHIPHRDKPNAYLSNCIRWVVEKLILELSAEAVTTKADDNTIKVSQLCVGTKILFDEEPVHYTIKALSERYAICTRLYNPKRTVIYTIIDFKEGVRGTNNLVFNIYDYKEQSDIDACMKDLINGECEITRRNRIDLSVKEIVLPAKKLIL